MNYYRFLGASFLNASFSTAGNGTIVDDAHFNMKDTVNGAIIAAPTVRYTNISGEVSTGPGSYNATAASSGIRAGVVNMRSGATNVNSAAGIVIGSSADTSKNHNYDALVEPIYNISNTPVPNTASDKTSPVFDSNNGTWTRTLNNQFTNSNAGNGITINEVGMIADYVSFWASADSYVAKYSSTRMLLDRTVLEAPVILNLSASVIITYTIQFSWPRALNN
jgi:hypothetical protein